MNIQHWPDQGLRMTFALVILMMLTSCTQMRQWTNWDDRTLSTAAGGLLGAGTGAILGDTIPGSSPGTGAAIGGGLGLLAGLLVGQGLEANDAGTLEQRQRLQQMENELQRLRQEQERLRQERTAMQQQMDNDRQAMQQRLDRAVEKTGGKQ